MDEERDLITLEDNDGNEVVLEVVDYIFYEGEEYALLEDADAVEPEACAECEREECGACENKVNAYVMKVIPINDEEEELEPIDEELAETIIDLVNSGAFNDDGYDPEEDDQE